MKQTKEQRKNKKKEDTNKWRQRHSKKELRLMSYRSSAKSFILKHASKKDLERLMVYINEKMCLLNLEKMPVAKAQYIETHKDLQKYYGK